MGKQSLNSKDFGVKNAEAFLYGETKKIKNIKRGIGLKCG